MTEQRGVSLLRDVCGSPHSRRRAWARIKKHTKAERSALIFIVMKLAQREAVKYRELLDAPAREHTSELYTAVHCMDMHMFKAVLNRLIALNK